MSIKYNSSFISDIKYNNKQLDIVKYNGVTVYQRYSSNSPCSGSTSSTLTLYRSMNNTDMDGTTSGNINMGMSSSSGDAFKNTGNGVIQLNHDVKSCTIKFNATAKNIYDGAAAIAKLADYTAQLQILKNGSVIKTTNVVAGSQYKTNGGAASGSVSVSTSLSSGDKITFKVKFSNAITINTGVHKMSVYSMSYSMSAATYA